MMSRVQKRGCCVLCVFVIQKPDFFFFVSIEKNKKFSKHSLLDLKVVCFGGGGMVVFYIRKNKYLFSSGAIESK